MENQTNQNGPIRSGEYDAVTPPEYTSSGSSKEGLAIASLITGLMSIFSFCCCGFTILLAPFAVIFGAIVLIRKKNGKRKAITGLILGSLSLITFGSLLFSMRDILPYSDIITADFVQLISEQDEVFPKYEEDGTLPDYLQKYTDAPYTEMMAKYDGDFYDVMDMLLESYKAGTLPRYNFVLPSSEAVSEAAVSAAEPEEPAETAAAA
ncbi:MAG: DUF4190 domain-containing protein [Oscillospiraceae bacterium]|nr:DUF4190 domain-containing protein [Oscillospiraceae bacterium]